MIYAKSIHLIGFQQHKDLKIELSPGVNLVVGPTGSGKSSIIRAFSWVIFGIPKGDVIRGYNTKQTSVSIEWSNGYTTKRIKSSTINAYEITDPKSETIRMDAIGSGVPSQITELLGIQPFKCDKFDVILNISKQLGLPFLLDLSASDRMKIFNQLTGNDLLDKVLVSFNKDALNASKELKFNEEQAKSRQNDVELLQTELMPLKALYDKSGAIYNNILKKESIYNKYIEINTKYIELCDKEADLSFELSQLPDISKIDFDRINKSNKQLIILQQLREKYNQTLINIIKYKELIRPISNIDFNKIKLDINKLIKLKEIKEKFTIQNTNLSNLLGKQRSIPDIEEKLLVLRMKINDYIKLNTYYKPLKTNEANLITYTDELEKVSNMIHDIDKQYNNMLKSLGKCPTCKRSFENCKD